MSPLSLYSAAVQAIRTCKHASNLVDISVFIFHLSVFSLVHVHFKLYKIIVKKIEIPCDIMYIYAVLFLYFLPIILF